jgi:membrane protein YdbS with pleckstrin-like domain
MPYPRRLLLDDEEIVLDLHPHWRRIAVPVLALPVVAGVGAYVAGIGPDSSAYRLGVLVVAMVLLALVSLRRLSRWHATRYVVTTRRVIIRSGGRRRSGRDVALHRVTGIALDRGMADRLFRSGDLILECAREQTQLVLTDVPGLPQVHQTVYELADLAELDQRAEARGG